MKVDPVAPGLFTIVPSAHGCVPIPARGSCAHATVCLLRVPRRPCPPCSSDKHLISRRSVRCRWDLSFDALQVPEQARGLDQGAELMRRAQDLWTAWRRPWHARGEADMVEVLMPRLVRREARRRTLVAAEPARPLPKCKT